MTNEPFIPNPPQSRNYWKEIVDRLNMQSKEIAAMTELMRHQSELTGNLIQLHGQLVQALLQSANSARNRPSDS